MSVLNTVLVAVIVLNTFDRHVVARFLAGTVLLTGTLIVFFINLHYVEYVDDFMDRGASTAQVFGHYYPNYLPEIVKLVTPLAAFLSCVFLTGKLAAQGQLVALQTSGVSLYRILRPFLLVGFVMTGALFWFDGWVVPKTNAVYLAFEEQYRKDAPKKVDVTELHRQDRPGQILLIGYFDSRNNVAHRVSLQSFDSTNQMRSRIDAERMTWIDSTSSWKLTQAKKRDFGSGSQTTTTDLGIVDTVLTLYPRHLSRTERDVESMTLPDARDHVERLRISGAGNLGRSIVAYHSKYNYALTIPILIVIAVSLASVSRRSGQAVRLGIAALLAFVYLTAMKVSEPFGYVGDLPPALASWLPHFGFAIIAVVMLVIAKK